MAAIKRDAPEAKQAAQLRHQFEQAQKKRDAEIAKQRAVEAQQKAAADALVKRALRDGMAKNLEDRLLSEGYNVDVNAIGKDHTTMRIKWILVSKVLAHQLTEDGTFLRNCREVGFKRVEITDGYEETWYWNL